ncbi:hypothetical protein JRQ81_002535 [Phrynocephalus forsythii]|uniref:Uncharacterized protein n=1 Tax=Phrynocephalus forsythii TaxID=171643 RepID=A0A9Q0XKB1_9SAUR|nr:hypothetical protein JRQ81_002535 [Phrynocephalus forsythii]
MNMFLVATPPLPGLCVEPFWRRDLGEGDNSDICAQSLSLYGGCTSYYSSSQYRKALYTPTLPPRGSPLGSKVRDRESEPHLSAEGCGETRNL